MNLKHDSKWIHLALTPLRPQMLKTLFLFFLFFALLLFFVSPPTSRQFNSSAVIRFTHPSLSLCAPFSSVKKSIVKKITPMPERLLLMADSPNLKLHWNLCGFVFFFFFFKQTSKWKHKTIVTAHVHNCSLFWVFLSQVHITVLRGLNRRHQDHSDHSVFLYEADPFVESICTGSTPEPWLHAELLFSPLFTLYGSYFPLKATSCPSPPQLYQTPTPRGKIWLCAAEGEKRFYKFWCQMFSRV